MCLGITQCVYVHLLCTNNVAPRVRMRCKHTVYDAIYNNICDAPRGIHCRRGLFRRRNLACPGRLCEPLSLSLSLSGSVFNAYKTCSRVVCTARKSVAVKSHRIPMASSRENRCALYVVYEAHTLHTCAHGSNEKPNCVCLCEHSQRVMSSRNKTHKTRRSAHC